MNLVIYTDAVSRGHKCPFIRQNSLFAWVPISDEELLCLQLKYHIKDFDTKLATVIATSPNGCKSLKLDMEILTYLSNSRQK